MRQDSPNFKRNHGANDKSSIGDLIAEIAVGMTHFAEGLAMAVEVGLSRSPKTIRKNGSLNQEFEDA